MVMIGKEERTLSPPPMRRAPLPVRCSQVQEVVADFAALGRTLTVAESVDAAFPEAADGSAAGVAEGDAECKAEALRAAGARQLPVCIDPLRGCGGTECALAGMASCEDRICSEH